MTNNKSLPKIDVPTLAAMGGGQIAYVRRMSSADVKRAFPQSPDLQPGREFFALLHADGSPILLTDTAESALANAIANDLQPVSVH